jgi:hypothetical protein
VRAYAYIVDLVLVAPPQQVGDGISLARFSRKPRLDRFVEECCIAGG